jgi:aminoglycoside phosphotransferase family enzyme/predicted kinase
MEQQVVTDQSDVFAFLGDPATHGLHEPIKRIDTHGAAVFLAGGDVYKVKRAVRLAFMDFSTLDKRRHACERELTVNEANAPDLYLGVVPISKDRSGLRLGGSGTIVEWAVHMRRFDENRTLDCLAERNELNLEIMIELANVVAASHGRAPIIAQKNSTQALQWQIEETLVSLEAAPEIFPAQAVGGLRNAMQQTFSRLEPRLAERERQGQVRRCHGDLHLRNIALIENRPILFDAIEFDEAIATCDVLYDLAFLLMDLWMRGLRRHANLLFNRYLSICHDREKQFEGLALLPLFLALRAAIRAKVIILQPRQQEEQALAARCYFEAACAFLVPCRLDLVAIGGLSGTGKSSLAAALAASVGRAPGAVHLRGDVERKRLFHIPELDHLPSEAYRPEYTVKVYGHLRDLAQNALDAGQGVVIDAVHLRPEERIAVKEVATRSKAHFTGVWLEAPIKVLKERVGSREMDASDATADVVSAQAQEPTGPMEWERFEASGPIGPLVERALAAISR